MDFDNPDVKTFVQQVKTNTYAVESPAGFVEVPDFKQKDIPELLKYAKDNTPIRGYPANPVSSISSDYYRLSQCLLWTIEKVRTNRYPSLTPLLYKQAESEELVITDAAADIMAVWELYSKWWEKVENESLGSSIGYIHINPLEDSIYSW